MNRLLRIALLSTLALAGCSRAPQQQAASDTLVVAPDPKPPETPSLPPGSVVFTPETHALVSPEEVPLLEEINRENSRVVASAMPSLVRITATHTVDPRVRLFGNDIPFHLPFGHNPHRNVPMNDTSYGSGVIIGRDGYILTNNHVVGDANVLQVQLSDKRSFEARLVAADDLVDIAILKIDATGLAPLPWGDSDKVQVGDQVFAIGNPFDLDDSISKGIVSAKGRNLPQTEADMPHYEDFIQTDAAINQGNSGGALVNIRGELIGINAAIASTNGFNMGIGFAIPSDLVRYAVEGLLKSGHLVRGYLGVILPDNVDDGVVSQLQLKSSQGAFLAGVKPHSPADDAKLQAFDFITGVDGRKVDSEAELRLIVAQIPIGKQVKVDFVRDGKLQSTLVRVAEMPRESQLGWNADAPVESGATFPPAFKPPPGNVLAGLEVTDLNDKTRQKLASQDLATAGGVVVNNVQQDSPADVKGIERGDVIESFSLNRGSIQPLASAKDFTSLSNTLKPDQGIVLLVHDYEKGGHVRSSFIYLAPPPK